MSNRFFPATLLGGRLHVSTGEGPWDPSRFDLWKEDELDLILSKREYGTKIRTPEELEAVMKAPVGVRAHAACVDPRNARGRRASAVGGGEAKGYGTGMTDALTVAIVPALIGFLAGVIAVLLTTFLTPLLQLRQDL